jgi:hypothetical protein
MKIVIIIEEEGKEYSAREKEWLDEHDTTSELGGV